MSNEELSREDAIRAMMDGEILTGNTEFLAKGLETKWDGNHFLYRSDLSYGEKTVWFLMTGFDHLMHKPEPKTPQTRPMTRFECLAWANSTDSLGWFVCCDDIYSPIDWSVPQYFNFILGIGNYSRARLLPDKSGIDESTIQGFEVEVEGE